MRGSVPSHHRHHRYHRYHYRRLRHRAFPGVLGLERLQDLVFPKGPCSSEMKITPHN